MQCLHRAQKAPVAKLFAPLRLALTRPPFRILIIAVDVDVDEYLARPSSCSLYTVCSKLSITY